MFLFGTGENSGKLAAERIYFDNETVQIRGTQEASSVPDFGPLMVKRPLVTSSQA
jgi:hypothetical protein